MFGTLSSGYPTLEGRHSGSPSASSLPRTRPGRGGGTPMVTRHDVKVRRIYEDPLETDGARILVDRLWPRGLARATANIDQWCKAIAPSPALRKWYGHDPSLFE